MTTQQFEQDLSTTTLSTLNEGVNYVNNDINVAEYLADPAQFYSQPAIPVCKPNSSFRIEKGSECYCYLIYANGQWYFVHPSVANMPGIACIQKTLLYKGVYENGSEFLIPLTESDRSRSDTAWYANLNEIMSYAIDRWMLGEDGINSILSGCDPDSDAEFDVLDCVDTELECSTQSYTSTVSMEECIKIAFKNNFISTQDHPVIIAASKKIKFNNFS